MTAALVTRTAPTRTRRPIAVRVRSAPPLEPPFDDDVPADARQAGGPMLPLDWPHLPPPRGTSGTGSDPSTSSDDAPTAARHDLRDQRDAPTDAPSAAAVAARRFISLCVEVLNGFRPASHLRPFTAPAQLTAITGHLVRRTARRHLAGPRAVVRIKTIRVCEPRPGVAEVAAVLTRDTSTWAMAARLERREQTWLCTVVEVL
jgi:hypothetical protein